MRVVKERLRYVVNAYNLRYAGSRWAGELLRAQSSLGVVGAPAACRCRCIPFN